MRPNEERAQQKFTVLLGALTESPGTWRDGEDPPDFWLEWGGERFAVEVTEVMQSIPLGSGSLSERGLLAGLKSTVSGLETEILADGLLTGTFVLHACPVPDLRSQITALKAAVREYINSSAHLSRAPETQLLKGRRRQRWTIKKVHGTGAAILAGFSVGSVKWAMEATNDLRELLTERLETKTAKYKHLSEKKILLLVDSYLYVDWEHWVTASTVVAGKAFHTVAVVSSVFGCRVIRSENERWQRLHNIGLSGHCRSAER